MASKNGMIPGAPPTSPGGMSRKALAAELVETHGWDKADLAQFKPLNTWPQLIDAVIAERQMRENENSTGDLVGWTDEAAALEPDDITAEYDENEDAGFEAPHPDDAAVSGNLMTEAGRSPEDDGGPWIGDDGEWTDGSPQPLFIGMPDTKDYIFDGHMGASPSGAERWLRCTASLGASRAFLETLTPNQQAEYATSSVAARQGTTAHAAAEAEALVLLGRSTDEELTATILELTVEPEDGTAYDDEMAEYITEYTDLIQTYAQERGHDHVLIEQRVSAVVELLTVDADGDPEVHEIIGSADCIILPTEEEPDLVVADLKYGEGIDVEVAENPQAMIYALGALDLLADDEGNLITPVETITLHIVQPRLGGIKTWTTTLDALLDWRDDVLSKALTEALGGLKAGAAFVPGDEQCQWCPARGACPALIEERMGKAADLFDAIVEAEYEDGPGAFPETGSLSDADLGKFYSQVRGLTDLLSELKEEVQRRLHRGQDVPGYDLRNYSPQRKWTDDAATALEDRKDLWVRRLLTPAAAEKLLGDGYAEIASLVIKPEKVPVVSTGPKDKRSKWEGKPPETMFADETEGGA